MTLERSGRIGCVRAVQKLPTANSNSNNNKRRPTLMIISELSQAERARALSGRLSI